MPFDLELPGNNISLIFRRLLKFADNFQLGSRGHLCPVMSKFAQNHFEKLHRFLPPAAQSLARLCGLASENSNITSGNWLIQASRLLILFSENAAFVISNVGRRGRMGRPYG